MKVIIFRTPTELQTGIYAKIADVTVKRSEAAEMEEKSGKLKFSN